MPKRETTGTQSLDRAFAVLRLIAARAGRGIKLADLLRQSGLTRPTLHRLVEALTRQGFVAKDSTTRLYHLGPEAFVLGTLASERYGIHQAALPSLARLAEASEDTAFLTIRLDRHGVCLHRQEGAFPIRSYVLQPGNRHPLGVGAGCLAILASLPPGEADEMIAANTPDLIARYPGFPPATMQRMFALTRETGYALNPGLLHAGSWGVGVAVINRQGHCVGALSIAAIESRMDAARCERLAALLHFEANKLTEALDRPTGATTLAARARRNGRSGAA